MLTHLLILAQAAGAPGAAAGEAAGGITKITQEFGISWPFLLAQILNFSIVAFILWRFGFKPVLAVLDERQHKIDDGLKFAEEMKAKLAAAQRESEATARRAQLEATRVIEEAGRTAKEFLDKQTQEGAAKAAEIIAKAQQAIELEKRKMLAEARTEIARLVVVTTARVLAKDLSDAERSRFNESAARELTNV